METYKIKQNLRSKPELKSVILCNFRRNDDAQHKKGTTFPAGEENVVPQLQHGGHDGECVCEEREEPLRGDHLGGQFYGREVRVQLRVRPPQQPDLYSYS